MIDIKFIGSGSKGNCCRISDGATSLLLDAGLSCTEIMKGCGYKLSQVSGVLVTHRHRDHCKAVPKLLNMGLDVYAPVDVYDSFPAPIAPTHNAHSVYPCNPLFIPVLGGSWEIRPFAVPHDVPNVGYYLYSRHTGETLLYATDAMYIGKTFPRLDYILIEANYDPEIIRENGSSGVIGRSRQKRTYGTHMSIRTTLDMLRANNLSYTKQIWLMHLSDDNSNAEEFKKQIQQLCGCEVYIA